ncbi:origin recognition complex subunit 3 [Nilaparvata lugens]|uniref:origin recognition complex subunit 3 n=1 Tax=Nilaparvata lugens TaxID=108931 RepID=UPI00193DA3AA|nr:origin recognition complex subunit 3 [Nilaparvata lugens]
MSSTVSVSKGCFVFKPKDAKSKKRKATNCLDFSSEAWYQFYSKMWSKIEKNLEEINENVSQSVLDDLADFISKCDTVKGKISSAALLLGVNMPDHSTLFSALANRIRVNVTPHVAILDSIDFTNVRSAIEKMVTLLVKEKKHIDLEEVKRMYNRRRKGRPRNRWTDDVEQDLRTLGVRNWKRQVEDRERWRGFVREAKGCSDLQYTGRLPIVMIMGVATTASTIHKSLSHTATSQLSLRLFQSQPSVYFLNNTLDQVFLKQDCPFQLGSKVMKFLTDIFLFYDFSVDGFIKGIKYCVMRHFYGSKTNVLCCSKSDIKRVVDSLDKANLSSIEQLPSFQKYLLSLPEEKQAKIKSSSPALKEVLRNLMKELRDSISVFHTFLRMLHALVSDLPDCPLGKQYREIYSEAVSLKVTNSSSYKECFKILALTSKDELLPKLYKMLEILRDCNVESESVKNLLNKLKTHCKKLENVGLEPTSRTPTKSPSKARFNVTSRAQFKEHLAKLSETKQPANAYELARMNFLEFVRDELFEETLNPLTHHPLHEVVLFDDIASVKRRLIGAPRAALHTALNNPHHYLECNCCKLSNDGEILPTMPDVCIAYKLHLESSSLINMYDWLQSFAAVINPNGDSGKNLDDQIQARFTQAVAELQLLGFIKSTKKKTDHVVRLTWGGSA